jgi:O-antigen/teichoic acid export membrane protein
LNEQMYHGDLWFVAALAIGLVGFYVMHLSRGVLAGAGRFRAYGTLIGAEGVIRLGGGLLLAVVGVDRAGGYAMVLALAPFLAAAVVLRGQRGVLQPGPEAPYSELSASLGWLLLGSVLTQLLAYSSLLAVNILSSPDEKDIAAAFASAFFVARLPVLAFQAVQGTLLPKLAGLAGSGLHDEFRRGVTKLLTAVVAIAAIGTVAAGLVGPTVGKILFSDFSLSAGGLALLAAGSGLFIIAMTMAQALMALGGHRFQALAWGIGLLVCIVVTLAISDLLLRVEVGFLAGAAVAAVVMGAFALARMSKAGEGSLDGLIEAIEHEPMEI